MQLDWKPINKHLVIHFDINETVLVGDEAGGDTREDSLNKMVAKSAFCQMPSRKNGQATSDQLYDYESTSVLEPTHWWDGSRIQDSYEQDTPVPPLWTQWHWPTGCCPYYRTAFKHRSKTFLSHHGSIYRQLHDKLERNLVWENSSNYPVFSTHPVLSHLLPALFETIRALSRSNQQFTICFRTMGSDLQDIADAINVFCSGQHPHYPDFCDDSLRMEPHQLAQGKWRKQNSGPAETPVYQLWRDDTMVASGDEQVLDFIHSHSICGIVDDYLFWRKHHYAPWSGKPVWMLPPFHAKEFHHVLFDDNIHNLEHDGIASVRKQVCENGPFQTLSSAEILQQHGRHLVRVPTVEPVLDPGWFLEQLRLATASV